MSSGVPPTAARRRSVRALAAGLVLATAGGPVLVVPASAEPDAPERERVEQAPELRLLPTSDGELTALDVPLEGRAWAAASSRPLAAGRTVTTTGPMRTSTYSMVGFTWRGEGADIRVRASHDGAWGRWHEVEELHDGPDAGADEGRPQQRASDALWLGASDGIEVEVTGTRPRRFEMVLIHPGSAPRSAAGLDSVSPRSGAAVTDKADKADRKKTRPDRAPRPPIRGRRAWKADNSWRDGGPWYNRTLQQVHLHHTASGNSYRKRDVPGLIRGMYRYHTYNLGWSDIGYNFLVDRFGRRWVGRAGGAAKPVRGAHTLGFNSTSVGIGVIGNYERTRPRQKVLTSLVRLAAWKLDPYDRKARSRVKVYSHGSDKYPEGRKVWLKTIDGHRDTNDTACPGEKLYDRLPGIRRRTAERINRFS